MEKRIESLIKDAAFWGLIWIIYDFTFLIITNPPAWFGGFSNNAGVSNDIATVALHVTSSSLCGALWVTLKSDLSSQSISTEIHLFRSDWSHWFSRENVQVFFSCPDFLKWIWIQSGFVRKDRFVLAVWTRQYCVSADVDYTQLQWWVN